MPGSSDSVDLEEMVVALIMGFPFRILLIRLARYGRNADPVHPRPDLASRERRPVAWFTEKQAMILPSEHGRALFAGQAAASDIWVAVSWFLGILVVAYTLGIGSYRRKIS